MVTLKTIGSIPIKNATELDPWGVCIAIYGEPGVGKTTMAGNVSLVPSCSPVLVLDAEGGTRSITHLKNVGIVEIATWAQLQQATKEIFSLKDQCPYKTIVLDNMSEIQNIHMKSILSSGATAQFSEWNKNTAEMLQFTRAWRDFARFCHINVILIAWSFSNKDEISGIVKKEVGFTPSLASKFPGIVDIVGYLTVDTKTQARILSFESSVRTASKFRRSGTESARKIPLNIVFNENQNPLGDILSVLRDNTEWPIAKYRESNKGG